MVKSVDTRDLKSLAFGHASSILASRTTAPVAQWLEQRTHNPLVLGSSPSGGTMSLVRIMDNTEDFYSSNMGSIPVRGAI